MSSYNQNNLLIPLIIVLGNNGGSAKTSELIGILDSVLLPTGDDLIPYNGRKDSKFSQTVRNALAPERSPQLISEGYANVIGNEGENKYVLTERGWEIYRNLLSVKIKDKVCPATRPLQQIFYGAPGTGKSKTIKDITEGAENKGRVFRTTFHPDSDYSTFVGVYKPKTIEVPVMTIIGKEQVPVVNAEPEKKIIYEFVPQAFVNAYIKAWNTNEDVYLIIEEINRGNCAQIFGDLFQLLDRGEDGKSEYPIDADTDLGRYIAIELGDSTRTDFPDGVKDGKKLVLPNNLFIWATMNTSDQSLFPIDSAFKRRWDWVYVPIDTAKETWYIKIGESYYSWTLFLDKVNDELLTDETAEDKHLGFYFCKATEKKDGTEIDPNVITAETFVGKVLFYLWNDVFKVYDIPTSIGSSKDWPYRKFYQTDGKVDEQKVIELMKKLNIAPEEGGDNQTKEVEESEDQ